MFCSFFFSFGTDSFGKLTRESGVVRTKRGVKGIYRGTGAPALASPALILRPNISSEINAIRKKKNTNKKFVRKTNGNFLKIPKINFPLILRQKKHKKP